MAFTQLSSRIDVMAVKNTLVVYSTDTKLIDLMKLISAEEGMDLLIEENGRELANLNESLRSVIIIIDTDVQEPCIINCLDLLALANCLFPIVIIGDCEDKLLLSLERIGASKGLMVFSSPKRKFHLEQFKELSKLIDKKGNFINIEQLALALEKNEFKMFYQPKIALKTNKLVGLEALIRWERPAHGLVFPDAFVPIAEESGLIIPLTYWIIQDVFKQYAIWKKKKLTLNLAINLTPSILTDLLFPDELVKLSQSFQVDPEHICFEITEAAAMQREDTVLEVLTRIRLKKFSLSIDDFGTGYSSLVELQRLPFTEMKIDRSFVCDLETNELNRNIVKSVIDLGKNMHLSLVAEGVETQAAFDKLKKLGCDVAQGYLIAKPMSVSDFYLWYKQKIDANGVYTG